MVATLYAGKLRLAEASRNFAGVCILLIPSSTVDYATVGSKLCLSNRHPFWFPTYIMK